MPNNENKFTKGEWELVDERGAFLSILKSSCGKIVAIFKRQPNNYDAHLIAAAPELYQSAIDAMAFLESIGFESSDEYESLKSSLIKARGEQ